MSRSKSFQKILGASLLTLASLSGSTYAAQVTDVLQITLHIVGSCTVQGGTLDFGQTSDLSTPKDGDASFSVKCTNTLPYKVALGTGLHANNSQRRLERNGAYLDYELYQNSARTQVWGDVWDTNTKAGVGSGLDEFHHVYGQLPAQNLPTFGQFQDTVLITVQY